MARKYNFKDLTGQQFGNLKVISFDKTVKGVSKWICECSCGQIKSVYGTNLTRGLSNSCGCQKSKLLKTKLIDDITGNKYGKLKVISLYDDGKGRDAKFECLCDCGNKKVAYGKDLKTGKTKSCGCIKKEYIPKNKTHGMSKNRIYKIWAGIHQRCENENNPKYPIYGGRGIKVCDDWKEFTPFMEWALNNGYIENLTIERKNVNGNYEPLNCIWVDLKQQANNTRKTVFLTYKGETKPASEWSKITGIPQDTITSRKRRGWSDERNIETPSYKYHRRDK